MHSERLDKHKHKELAQSENFLIKSVCGKKEREREGDVSRILRPSVERSHQVVSGCEGCRKGPE